MINKSVMLYIYIYADMNCFMLLIIRIIAWLDMIPVSEQSVEFFFFPSNLNRAKSEGAKIKDELAWIVLKF